MLSDILLVVDMQNDFITGSLGTKEAQEIVDNVINKVRGYTKEKKLIIFTKDTHYKSLYSNSHEGRYLPVEHCIQGTNGWEIEKNILAEVNNEMVRYISKGSFGKYYWDNAITEEFKSIEIIGLCTDICVISNALILRSRFPEAYIIIDASCCAGTSPEKHKEALDVMRSCHIDIIN